jgi:hypothetical protein
MGKRIVTLLGVVVLVLVVLTVMNAGVWAQEGGMCIVPTGSGQALNDLGSIVKAYASDDEISPAAPVNVWVDSGGFGRPPYQWQVTGTGYTLSASETNGDFIPVTLSVVGGTCGTNYSAYATVTVTDANSVQDSIKIRNIGGEWSDWQGCARTHCYNGGDHLLSCYRYNCDAGGGPTPCHEDEIYYVSPVFRFQVIYGCFCEWWESPPSGYEWGPDGSNPVEVPSECPTPYDCLRGEGTSVGCGSQGICIPDNVHKSYWGCP